MNKKKRNIITEIIAFFISAAICVGCWLTGYFFVEQSRVFLFAAIAAIAFIILAIAVNVLRTKVYVTGMARHKIEDTFNYLLGNDTNIEKKYGEAEERMNRRMHSTMLYAAGIMFLLAATCFLMGAAEPEFTEDDGGFSLAILPLICLFGQGIAAFFIRKEKRTKPEYHTEHRLTESEFPLINGLVKDCAETLKIKKDVHVYYTSSEIKVRETKNTFLVFVNPINAYYYTSAELKAVILHELLHCINLGTIEKEMCDDFLAESEGSLSQFGIKAFISYPISKTLLAMTVYHQVAARKKATQADEYIIENGQADNYINAIAKTELYSRYRTYPWRETGYDLYSYETPLTYFAHYDFNNFKNKLAVYRDRWFFSLYNELPRSANSAPSFTMLMTSFGKTDFNVDATETDSAYLAEQDKYLSLADKIVCERFSQESYELAREDEYLKRKKILDEYEQKKGTFRLKSEAEKIRFADTFIGIDNKIALELLDQALDTSINSMAFFLRGILLSDEYDDDCIEMFKRASYDPLFFDESMEYLLLYAIKTGKTEVIEEYRDTVEQRKRAALAEESATEITNCKLLSPDRRDIINNDVILFLRDYWGKELRALYLAEAVTESGKKVKYIGIDVFIKKAADYRKHHSDTIELIYRLSDENTKFYFFYRGNEFNMIKNTKDSLMYFAVPEQMQAASAPLSQQVK